MRRIHKDAPPPTGGVNVGERYGYLVAIRIVGADRFRVPIWYCVCDCGGSIQVRAAALRRRRFSTVSCGCKRWALQHGRAQPGADPTGTYRAWTAMRHRCMNTKAKHYRYYGGRGIRVCERWSGADGFKTFVADMGDRPSSKHSLDRIDPNGNYEPGNCRWATMAEQARTRRLSAPRVRAVLERMLAGSSDLLERRVLERVRRELIG